jgi:hypothetical protein
MAPQTPAVVMDKYVQFRLTTAIEANHNIYIAVLVIRN